MADVKLNPDGTSDIEFRHEPKANITYPDNLAIALDSETTKAISERVVEDYLIDKSSRSVWEERRAKWLTTFNLYREPKTNPWVGCSNVSMPTLTVAALQFQARAFEAIFSQKDWVTGKWDDLKVKDRATRVGRYMNWQLQESMTEWAEDMDEMFMQLAINGSAFKKTYYDKTLSRPVSVYISVDDFLVPYDARRLEDASRKTHILRMINHEVRVRVAAGEYIPFAGESYSTLTEKAVSSAKVDGLTIPSTMNTPEVGGVIQEAKDKITGVTQSITDSDSARVILEQHRLLDLDNDGIGEHYVVTVDLETKHLFRIESLEYKDAVGRVQVADYFTQYTFIPNPGSIYGIGLGQLLYDLNESITTLTNQVIDAGHLSNSNAGLANKRSGIKQGDLTFKVGEFKGVDSNVDDLRKAIYKFDFNPPSPVLFQLLSMLQDYANRVSTVSDTLMGQMPPSDTAATTVLAVLEQGLKVFSVIQRRIHRSLKKELSKLFLINSIYVDEKEYMEVLSLTSPEAESFTNLRDEFSSLIKVIPASDPNISSQAEQLIRNKTAYEFGMQNPIIANDPEAVFVLTKNYTASLRADELYKVLKKPQPQTPPDLSPTEENAGFLQEKSANVLPQQDHANHLLQHDDFKNSNWYNDISAHGKNLFETHHKDTLAALYLKQQGELNASIQNQPI